MDNSRILDLNASFYTYHSGTGVTDEALLALD